MKNILFIWISITTLFKDTESHAQPIPLLENNRLVNSKINENVGWNPCISEVEYLKLEKRCTENTQKFKLNRKESELNTAATLLSWPLKAASSLKDCSYYYISAFVDQNINAGTIQDYNCGMKTYDGHAGTDISIWPFNFYKMDNDLVEVIAATPGVILDKHDGEFDKNCGSNNPTANYIIIQHADGSQANYWHMKKNSLTSKSIGQTVVAGEKLGIVGSSGSSSGPHLHFEVWAGKTKSTRIDPFAGMCNSLNTVSWWASQKSYKETSIIKVSVNSTDIILPPCPATETLNERDTFQVPFQGPGLAPGFAKFYIFIRDELAGLTADMSILNPDGTVFASWTSISAVDSKIKTLGFSKKLPLIAGNYIFKASYNGITCSKPFTIVNTTGYHDLIPLNQISIYPNPSNGKFIFQWKDLNSGHIAIFDLLGHCVWQKEYIGSFVEVDLKLIKGIYIYQVKKSYEIISSGKILIE